MATSRWHCCPAATATATATLFATTAASAAIVLATVPAGSFLVVVSRCICRCTGDLLAAASGRGGFRRREQLLQRRFGRRHRIIGLLRGGVVLDFDGGRLISLGLGHDGLEPLDLGLLLSRRDPPVLSEFLGQQPLLGGLELVVIEQTAMNL